MENKQVEQEHIKLKIIEYMLKNDLKGISPDQVLKQFYEQY